jgi:hypothetical protein
MNLLPSFATLLMFAFVHSLQPNLLFGHKEGTAIGMERAENAWLTMCSDCNDLVRVFGLARSIRRVRSNADIVVMVLSNGPLSAERIQLQFKGLIDELRVIFVNKPFAVDRAKIRNPNYRYVSLMLLSILASCLSGLCRQRYFGC